VRSRPTIALSRAAAAFVKRDERRHATTLKTNARFAAAQRRRLQRGLGGGMTRARRAWAHHAIRYGRGSGRTTAAVRGLGVLLSAWRGGFWLGAGERYLVHIALRLPRWFLIGSG
jgi:hypothetical protein